MKPGQYNWKQFRFILVAIFLGSYSQGVVVAGIEFARVSAGIGADVLSGVVDQSAWVISAAFPPVVTALVLCRFQNVSAGSAWKAVCISAAITAGVCTFYGINMLGWGWVDLWYLNPFSPLPIIILSILGVVGGLTVLNARFTRSGYLLSWLGLVLVMLTLWLLVYMGNVTNIHEWNLLMEDYEI